MGVEHEPQLAERGDIVDAPALDLNLPVQSEAPAYSSRLTIRCLGMV
jgi:hypothetical protein